MKTSLLSRVVLAVALGTAVCSGPVQGGTVNVLSWVDFNVGTSVIPGAVSDLGPAYSLTQAPDQGTFNSLLAGGGWNVVIFGEQNNSIYPGSASALTAYVGGGGKLIAATWLTGSGLLTLTQAGLVSSQDDSTITTDADRIFNSPYALGSTILLNNPGWGVFSQSYDASGGGVGIGALGSGYAVMRGNSGNTLLNAPLFDSYGNQTQGEQFVANEIYSLVNVPEVSSILPMALLALGAGIGFRVSRRQEKT